MDKNWLQIAVQLLYQRYWSITNMLIVENSYFILGWSSNCRSVTRVLQKTKMNPGYLMYRSNPSPPAILGLLFVNW